MRFNRTAAREYKRLRSKGLQASRAFYAAQTAQRWESAESAGLVRLDIVEDCDPSSALDYLSQEDLFPASLLKSETERAERNGVWGISGEYRLPTGERAPDAVPFETPLIASEWYAGKWTPM